jgi:ArsR family transcriptional regulator, lead/cadmium/zinc/bismuth-responsive transcriptional repressor
MGTVLHENDCDTEHAVKGPPAYSSDIFERAAAIFSAMGDEPRLRLLEYISRGEACVTEIAKYTGEGLSTVSQRLKILAYERLVTKERRGKHIYYSLQDEHILNLLQNALGHAEE